MKTPRELLLKRHEAALPKLDALRAAARATTPHPSPRTPHLLSIWERLFGPNPLAWAGLAAAWLVLLALNRDATGPARTTAHANRASQPTQAEVAEIVRERRREMAELLNLGGPKATLPARPESPPKRSQRREDLAVV